MEQSPLVGSVLEENSRFIAERAEIKDLPDFAGRLKADVDAITKRRVGQIPPQPIEEIVEEEGTAGHLPQPAKHIIAKEMLVGQRPSPLRLHEETVPTGEVERVVDMQAIHVIAEISPVLSADWESLAALRDTVLSLEQLVAAKNRRIPAADDKTLGIRIKETTAVLHLLKRGVLADTAALTTISIRTKEDIQKALQIIQASSEDVLQFHKGQAPNDPRLAYETSRKKINAAINADISPRNVVAQVVVEQRNFSWEDDFHRLVRHTTRDSFSYIEPGKMPYLAKFHEHERWIEADTTE
ncbi:MAG: hypothetical protein HY429_01700 [Candidatus Levybacteria bacterium]|nr:hypothetical protein [Candidatus Levybacteria bacterium]